ncbi:hypothetical protein RQP46_002546 [Phenoliferia psychrophenolica]
MARASFTTLPLELKARIIEMASDQEDAYNQRVQDLEARVGHINCLSSLALVNRELRGLAAEHQFKTIAAGRAALPVFRFTILPLHGRHFTKIIFDNFFTAEGSDNVLSAMGQLPSLRALQFQRDAALELFGSFQSLDISDEITAYRARLLALIAPKIDTLVLIGFDPREAGALIRRFPTLTTLAINDLGYQTDQDDIRELWDAVASARKLSNLTIHVEDSYGGLNWPSEALAPLEREPPPIKTLQLLGIPFTLSTFQLVGIFASTLTRLSLDLDEPDDEPDLASIIPIHLPYLTSLALFIDHPRFVEVTRILPSFPTLRHFFLLFFKTGVDPTDPSLLSFLAANPTLRDIRYEAFDRSYPKPTDINIIPTASSLAAYADVIHSRGLDPAILDQPYLTPFHAEADLDYTENEAGYLEDALERTLDFGKNELKRMRAEGNVAKAVGWVEKLRPLEQERLAWKD